MLVSPYEVKGTYTTAYSAYRREIISARGGKCEACPSRTKLTIHHLDGCGLNNAPENLQVLCEECHKVLNNNGNGNGISKEINISVSPALMEGLVINLWTHKITVDQWNDLKQIVDGLIRNEQL